MTHTARYNVHGAAALCRHFTDSSGQLTWTHVDLETRSTDSINDQQYPIHHSMLTFCFQQISKCSYTLYPALFCLRRGGALAGRIVQELACFSRCLDSYRRVSFEYLFFYYCVFYNIRVLKDMFVTKPTSCITQ